MTCSALGPILVVITGVIGKRVSILALTYMVVLYSSGLPWNTAHESDNEMKDAFDVILAGYQSIYEDKAPYSFRGTVKQVVFDLKLAHHEAVQARHEQMQAAGAAAAN